MAFMGRVLLVAALISVLQSTYVAADTFQADIFLISRARLFTSQDCLTLTKLFNATQSYILGPNYRNSSIRGPFCYSFNTSSDATAHVYVIFPSAELLHAYNAVLSRSPMVMEAAFALDTGCGSELYYKDSLNGKPGLSIGLPTYPVIVCSASGNPTYFNHVALYKVKGYYGCTFTLDPPLVCSPPPRPPPPPPPRPPTPPSPPDGICPVRVQFTRNIGTLSARDCSNVASFINRQYIYGATVLSSFVCSNATSPKTFTVTGIVASRVSALKIMTALNNSGSTADMPAQLLVGMYGLGCGDGLLATAPCAAEVGIIDAQVSPMLFSCVHPPAPPSPKPPPPSPPRSPPPPAAVGLQFTLKAPLTTSFKCRSIASMLIFITQSSVYDIDKVTFGLCSAVPTKTKLVFNVNLQFLNGVGEALAVVNYAESNIADLVKLYAVPCSSQISMTKSIGGVTVMDCPGGVQSLCCKNKPLV